MIRLTYFHSVAARDQEKSNVQLHFNDRHILTILCDTIYFFRNKSKIIQVYIMLHVCAILYVHV